MPRPDQPPAVEYQAQQGTPDQLPQGEASQLNQDVADTPTPQHEGADAGSAAADTSEPDLAQASDYQPDYQPQSSDEEFVFGPTTRPEEPVSAGAFNNPRRGLPPDLQAALPLFEDAANLPDSPEQMKFLLAALASLAES